jgi:hypothetical protein
VICLNHCYIIINLSSNCWYKEIKWLWYFRNKKKSDIDIIGFLPLEEEKSVEQQCKTSDVEEVAKRVNENGELRERCKRVFRELKGFFLLPLSASMCTV